MALTRLMRNCIIRVRVLHTKYVLKTGQDSAGKSGFINAPNPPNHRAMAVKALNPRLTIFQIVALQSFHYVMLGLIFEVNHVFLGSSLSLSCIFSPDAVKLNSVDGLADAFALILGQTINAVLLALIVEKVSDRTRARNGYNS